MAAKLPSLETAQRPTPMPAGGIASYRGAGGAETAVGEAGMRMGAQVTQLGNTVGRAGEEQFAAFKIEEEKTNVLRAEEAFSKLRERQLDLTYGAENGFMNLKGSAAVDRPMGKEWGERFNQAYKTLESELGNDDQKQKFRQRATIARLQYDEGILKHLASENDALAKQVTTNGIRSEVNIVAAQPLNERAMATSMERINSLIDKDVERQGLRGKAATEAADIAKRNVRDAMWNARIEALLYSQPMMAEQLFRANEKEISNPELRLQLQAKTREAGTSITASIEAQKVVDEVRSKMTSPESAEGVLTPVSNTGPVSYVFQSPAGDIIKGEAATEEEALRIGDQITGKRHKRVSAEERAMAPNTNGLPNSRDLAAQMPFMIQQVEKRADTLYGKDQGNPDRAAFIRRMTTEIQSRVSADVQALNAIQKHAHGTLVDAIAGIGLPGGAGPVKVGGRPTMLTAFSQIQADQNLFRLYQQLDPLVKPHILNLIQKNSEVQKPGDEVLYRELWNRIQLDPGQPGKIEFDQEITKPEIANRLSIPQINELRSEIKRYTTPGGRGQEQLRKNADAMVNNWFRTNLMTNLNFLEQKLTNPTAYIDWTNRWNEAVGKKVDEYVKAGATDKVRQMFMPGTPESVIEPAYLQTFMGKTAATTAAPAAGAQPQVPAVRAPANLKTPEDVETWVRSLPAGTTHFIDPAGNQREIPGRAGAPAVATAEAPAAAGMPSTTPVQMTETGKLVQPPAPKAKGELPTFRAGPDMSEEARAMHRGALWEAIKSIPKAVGRAALEAGVAPMILAGDFVRWLSEQPKANREAGARGALHFVLDKDSFGPEDIPTIQAALQYGNLGVADRRKARALLEAAGVQ